MAETAISEGAQTIPELPPSIAPLEVSEELKPRIDELDLWQNVEELRDPGYTIVRDIAPPEVMDDLREAIHKACQETEGPNKGVGASWLVGRSPAIDKVVTLPKLLALSEFSIGKGFRFGHVTSSILRAGTSSSAGTLHADQSWLPAPFPEHNCLLTFCIPCEGMTEEGGATRVVPGSNELRRHATPEELETVKWISLEAEKGSCAVWTGSVWHGTGVRTIPGTRTVLHCTYQRLYTQPVEDYSHLLEDEEYMANAPEPMASLLGANLAFGTTSRTSGGPDMEKFLTMIADTRR